MSGEYLHTSFDCPDWEYLDGEVVERNMGELPHSDVQVTLVHLLKQLRARLGIRVGAEIWVRISATRYRVPDVAVWRNDDIGDRIPTVAPFLIVEVLSPQDRMTRVQPKIAEYLSIGVAWTWVVDPIEGNAIIFLAE